MDAWRQFDLSKRKANISRAFERRSIRCAEEFPIVINTPCYFGFGNAPMPPGYWEDPAVMTRYQEEGFARHLAAVDDDTVPYFMPWFGTGVIASAYGCAVREATGDGDDMGIAGTCIGSVADIARLRRPDPDRSGLMPRVLRFIDYALRHSDLPVGLTDMNSPLSTAAQMCGYDRLFVWMYEEPGAVHDLMGHITDTLIDWVKTQKEHIGEPLDQSNGLQGVWSPKGMGVWLSDDDLISVGPDQYAEFVVPYNSRIFETFGGGSLHFCGQGLHQAGNLLKTRNIRCVNNSPMGRFETFGKLFKALGGRVTVQIQDVAPENPGEYYAGLFDRIDDLSGVMLATFVVDRLAISLAGETVPADRDALDAARLVVRSVRDCVERKLTGRA